MTPPLPSARLLGVDAARGVALLGMTAVHVTPALDAAAQPSALHLAFGGVASVLFALLAGVGLALLTGGAAGPTPERLPALRRQVARRAGILFLLGLLCGALGTPVAVILCHYGLLFLVVLPFLGLRARALAPLAAGALLLGPVLLFALTAAGQAAFGAEAFTYNARLWVSPAPWHLLDPILLALDLLLTGYYPVLSWAGFVLLGLTLGRLPLDRVRVAGALAAGGAAAWAATSALGLRQRHDPVVLERIAARVGADPAELTAMLATNDPRLAALVPDPLWLVLVSPHDGSVLEAVRCAGWACAVLGLALLLLRHPGPALTRAAAPLTGAGRTTLTLYVGHLVLLAALALDGVELQGAPGVAVLWALCLGVGLAVQASGRRGPLEAAVGALSRGAVRNGGAPLSGR